MRDPVPGKTSRCLGLPHVLSRLNHGLDIAGQSIGEPTALLAGVMVNPAAADLDRELRRFEFKVEAGAEFVVTRPVFDVAAFERFLRRIEHLKIPVIAGIWPFGPSTPNSWRMRCRMSSCR